MSGTNERDAERQVREQSRVDAQIAGRADENRMAIGRGFRDELGGDDAVRTCAIIDHHLLAEALRELRRQQPRDQIDSAARRKTNDNAYRLARVGLCACETRRRAHDQHIQDSGNKHVFPLE